MRSLHNSAHKPTKAEQLANELIAMGAHALFAKHANDAVKPNPMGYGARDLLELATICAIRATDDAAATRERKDAKQVPRTPSRKDVGALRSYDSAVSALSTDDRMALMVLVGNAPSALRSLEQRGAKRSIYPIRRFDARQASRIVGGYGNDRPIVDPLSVSIADEIKHGDLASRAGNDSAHHLGSRRNANDLAKAAYTQGSQLTVTKGKKVTTVDALSRRELQKITSPNMATSRATFMDTATGNLSCPIGPIGSDAARRIGADERIKVERILESIYMALEPKALEPNDSADTETADNMRRRLAGLAHGHIAGGTSPLTHERVSCPPWSFSPGSQWSNSLTDRPEPNWTAETQRYLDHYAMVTGYKTGKFDTVASPEFIASISRPLIDDRWTDDDDTPVSATVQLSALLPPVRHLTINGLGSRQWQDMTYLRFPIVEPVTVTEDGPAKRVSSPRRKTTKRIALDELMEIKFPAITHTADKSAKRGTLQWWALVDNLRGIYGPGPAEHEAIVRAERKAQRAALVATV